MLFGRFILVSVFVLSGLILANANAKAAATKSAVSAKTGVLQTSAGRYEFTLTTCAIYNEDGFDDIEVQGRGITPDGETFFFELSSTANAMTIGLGVDSPFASPERQLKAGRFDSQEFSIVTSENQVFVADLVLVDENGASIDDHANLNINCDV